MKLGRPVTLECALPVDSRPESIHWYHNEVEIFLSPQYNISYKPDQGLCLLTIERVRQESRGRYVCTVYINGQARSTAMDLEVIIPVEEKVIMIVIAISVMMMVLFHFLFFQRNP